MLIIMALASKKTLKERKLVKEFNEFLGKTDIDSLYYKWTHSKTKDLHIDKIYQLMKIQKQLM